MLAAAVLMSADRAPGSCVPTPEDEELWEMILWSDTYCTGNTEIDRDHQRLVALFNTFSSAMNAGEGEALIESVLEDLADYVRYHFAREEALMVETGYPGYAAHKKMHDIFSAQVADVLAHHVVGSAMSAFLLSFLAKWLTGHILGADQQLGAYLAKLGRTA